MPNVCSATLAPGIAAFNRLSQAGKLCEIANFDDTLKTLCMKGITHAAPEALLPVDRKVLCSVLCCCNRNPNISSGGSSFRQDCVRETMDAVDRQMGGKSRYKAEVSYNMRAKPPEPLMDKLLGNLTTRPLQFPREYGRMIGRINRDYPGRRPVLGRDTRRPDVVIVRDPSRPPTRDNIARVVEMKFPGDGYNQGQYAAYQAIDPKRAVMELDVDVCGCSDDRRTQSQVEMVKVAEAAQEAQRSRVARVAYGTLAVLAGAAAVAALVIPFDGPVGETALGSGAVSAGAMAFGRAALTPASIVAAQAAAAQSWGLIFGGSASATP